MSKDEALVRLIGPPCSGCHPLHECTHPGARHHDSSAANALMGRVHCNAPNRPLSLLGSLDADLTPQTWSVDGMQKGTTLKWRKPPV